MKFFPQVLLCVSLCTPGILKAQDPGDVLLHAVSLVRASRPMEAEQILRSLIERDPKLADARVLLGFLLLRRAAPEEAEDCFRAALSLSPEIPAARLGLGMALVRRGLFQSAAAEFSRVATDPSLGPRARAEYARNLFLMGRDRDAFEQARLLCEDYPLSAEPHAIVGFLYQTRGKPKAALECYRRASELAPGDLSYRFALIALHGDLRQWREMLDTAETALELDRNHPLLYQSRALALERLGRPAEAAAAKDKAANSFESEVLFSRALALDRAGQRSEATGLLRKCVKLNPDLHPARPPSKTRHPASFLRPG